MAILGRAQAYAPHLPRLLQYGAPPAVKVLVSRRVTGGRREPVRPHLSGLLTLGQTPATRIIVSRRVTGGQSRGFAPVGHLHLSKIYTFTPPAPTPPIPSAVFISRRVDRRGAPRIRPYLTGLIGFQPSPSPTIPVQARLKIDRNAAAFQIPPGLGADAQKLAKIVANTFLRENRNWRTLNFELYGPEGTDSGRTTLNANGNTFHLSGDVELDAGVGIELTQINATKVIIISALGSSSVSSFPFGGVLSAVSTITEYATYLYSGGLGISSATLPTPTFDDAGRCIAFKETNGTTGTFTINGGGGALIDGASSYVIPATAYARVILQTDGVNWSVLVD